MVNDFDDIKLDYNTEREKLVLPEYGRNISNMIEKMKSYEEKATRTAQAYAIVRAMEILNPQVYQQENYERKLWDHLYIIAGLDLDIDSPYPAPSIENINTKPLPIPLKTKPVKATHYGRNIESIIDLISTEPEGEVKTAMIKSLAIYMRQQYLIWNKDSVADETIFKDIEKLSDYRIKVPEGLELSKISNDASFARPQMSINVGQAAQKKRWNNQKGAQKKRNNFKK